MNNRNPYLITKALKAFLVSSILAYMSSQLATTTDAIVVSNLIGPDAISAINLVMPIITLFTCMMVLFGIGATFVAAKAIGRRDDIATNGVFTTGVIASGISGVTLSLIIYIFSPSIVAMLTGGDIRIYGYALSYLQTMCVAFPLLMMSGVVQNFVKTDGNPKLITYAVIAGTVVNLVLDIVFVKFLNMGIAGSAWATVINYLVCIFVSLIHFKNPHASLKWSLQLKLMPLYLKQSMGQGLPMSLNALVIGVCIFCINNIMLSSGGADGIYCWSVCLQVYMIMQMVLSGIGSTLNTIGGILYGERDIRGLNILNRKCLVIAVSALAGITAFILAAPEAFGYLFGSRSDNPIQILPYALRIFSLLLIPYAIVVLFRSVYQILGYLPLVLFLSVFQLIIMVLFVWAFSFIGFRALWWGFPASGIALLIIMFAYTFYLHTKNRGINPFTLIPSKDDSESLNISVKMDRDNVESAEKRLVEFLKDQGVDDSTTYQVRLACEELMNNIVSYAVAKHPEKHYFDLHIRTSPNEVNVLLKDDGRPFNPVITQEDLKINPESENLKLGLKLVNISSDSINYKYMYGQNMLMLKFTREERK